MAADAKAIEDMVSETLEWDDIDLLLTKFQVAVILEKFTSNEATSQIRPLLQLKEKKQEEVDNLLDGFICEQDFRGTAEFLMPYAESKDKVKTQKFDKWLGIISSLLSLTVGIINRGIQGDMAEVECQK
eukprot:13829888-Ditylum_brightwellii.AAC.1